MDLESHLADDRLKRRYVSTMFDIMAPGYNTFTRLFSFGMDKGWKERLIEEGARRTVKNPRLLDLACGTGDLGIALAKRTGAQQPLGLDLSPVMLAEASARIREHNDPLKLAACDMTKLCVRDASIDIVSIGYGIRNTGDVTGSLGEIARVLKPGGILLNLDFYKPSVAVWRELFLQYVWYSGNAAGWLFHREPMVYGYIAPSIRRFVTMRDFETALVKHGFKLEWKASHLGGAIGLHVARRG